MLKNVYRLICQSFVDLLTTLDLFMRHLASGEGRALAGVEDTIIL